MVRNDSSPSNLLDNSYEAVVLSPGPGVPSKAGLMMDVIEFYHRHKPILGICLGHQALIEFFGGIIGRAEKPMHGKLSDVIHNGDRLFDAIPSPYKVVRYHSLLGKVVPDDMEIIAKTESKEVMAIRHNALPIYGLQFHPEAELTQFGFEILRNWKEINLASN